MTAHNNDDNFEVYITIADEFNCKYCHASAGSDYWRKTLHFCDIKSCPIEYEKGIEFLYRVCDECFKRQEMEDFNRCTICGIEAYRLVSRTAKEPYVCPTCFKAVVSIEE